MLKNKTLFLLVLLLLVSPVLSAETRHLEKGRDEYLLAVAQAKKLVGAGKTKDALKALQQLKEDFPEIAGADLDTFIEAETLFSKGKLTKAVRVYDKLLTDFPESELYETALDRQFAIATDFLDGRKIRVLGVFKIKGYAQGKKIMERITDRCGDTPLAVKAAVSVAKSYEKRKKFDDAYHKWSQISSQWPTGKIAKDALLAMARCKHAAYKGPDYDASNLVSAKSYYENFKSRYPDQAVEFDVDKKLEQINERLAYKQFSIAQYYQKTGNRQSAGFYYQMVVDNWPGSKAAKTAKQAANIDSSSSKEAK